MNLRSRLTASEVQRLASPMAFARGLLYHRDDRVQSVEVEQSSMQATVRGTIPYRVELAVVDGELEWSCTCPAAEDGSFCKHCVALACVDTDVAERAFSPPAAGTDETDDAEVAAWLDELPRDQLVGLVRQAADRDWRLREQLVAQARADRGHDVDVASWRRRVEAAFAPDGDLVAYDEAADWAAGIDDVVDAMETLSVSGHPATVIDLAEHAHRCADAAMQYVDDSDGSLETISQRLADVHLDACRRASPDPVALAARLVDLELTSELDGFHRAGAYWSDVLGPAGLAEYRRLVEPRWQVVDRDTHGWSAGRYRTDQAMTGVALGMADPDLLIEVQAATPAPARDHLDLVALLVRADRHEEAIEWAYTGLDAMSQQPWQGTRLREVLAELLRGQGRTQDALQLYRDAFARSPSLSGYRELLAAAGPDADEVRVWAISSLHAALDDAATDADVVPGTSRGPSAALVEVLAHEGRIDEAWEVAVVHGCDDRMWLVLARAREDTHPLEAVDVYERQALARINLPSNHDYRDAVDLLARIRRLADQAGRPDRFTALLDRIRAEHSRKTNLRRLLEDQGWW